MKKLGFAFVTLLALSSTLFGQGTVHFNNRVTGVVDARVVLPDGTGAGAGWIAQLFLRTSAGALTPLQPSTTFRTSSAAAMGYLNSVDLTVPGVPQGTTATFVMRAFNGATFDTSTLRYESNPVTVTLGGGVLPPVNLAGLRSFTLVPIATVPSITVHPAGQALVVGSTVTFRVEATSTGPITYQWEKNGIPIPGATSNAYTLNNVTGFDAAVYAVVVSNAQGSVTSQAAILSLPVDDNTGSIVFNNRVTGTLDVRVILPDGTPAGAGWSAQLYGGPEGGEMQRLFPVTTFRTTSPAAMGYVNSVDVSVPGVKPGAKATLVMRVYNGGTFETSTVRLESNPFTVAVGGGTLPPANLLGLSSFHPVSDAKPFVVRELPPGYSPGAPVVVVLKSSPEGGVSVYAIEDFPPANWAVGRVSDGGAYDALTKKVKFGPFFDNQARTVTYEVIPPVTEQGKKQFVGQASADGLTSQISGANSIDAAVLHPADNNPGDARMTIAEVTSYGAAWRKGQSWVLGPNPIAIEYVTRAGALWKNGEAYVLDAKISGPPLWWVNIPAAGPSGPNAESAIRLASVAGGHAESHQRPQYVPGEAMQIEIGVMPSPQVSAYATEDQVPPGWVVAQISHGGEFDAVNGLVKWGPFFDNSPRALSYQILAPADATAPVQFAGFASFDGANTPVRGVRQAIASSRVKSLRIGADGKLNLDVTGPKGTKLVVEGTSDLKQWVRIDAAVNSNGTISFNDTAGIEQGLRFYRIVVE